ncbi:hypothetical protein [Streptomyces sp. SYSU K21746]
MLLRLVCLAVTNAFAALRLLPVSGRDKLRHQITVLERQLGGGRAPFAPLGEVDAAVPEVMMFQASMRR